MREYSLEKNLLVRFIGGCCNTIYVTFRFEIWKSEWLSLVSAPPLQVSLIGDPIMVRVLKNVRRQSE